MDELSTLHNTYYTTLQALIEQYKQNKLVSFVPCLPFILSLKGRPYTLETRPMMRDLFTTKIARATIIKSGRQISKTTTIVARAIVYSIFMPHVATLFVAPRYEQVRNISNNYARPFLMQSPISSFLVDPTNQSVLQRNLLNGSSLRFSFAFLSAERIRGISADIVMLDEFQDIDETFLPVIEETTAASKLFDISFYTGTPKTYDNILQKLWERSSQGEWVTKCDHCGYRNIASVEYDLLKMMLPQYLACAKCEKEINPLLGSWEHRFPDRVHEFPGYHIPQPIIPEHYSINPISKTRIKWGKLIHAMNTWSKASFYNEKLGEACDERTSLITLNNLRDASTIGIPNNIKIATDIALKYPVRILGVDWGGHGAAKTSYTALAVICPHVTSEKIDVIYLERLPYDLDELTEIRYVLSCFFRFKCRILAHDFAGSGGIRDTLLQQSGLRPSDLFPANYIALTSSNSIVNYKGNDSATMRHMYVVDKSRSLYLLCHMIRTQQLAFPKFETWSTLASDFTALVEDVKETSRSDIRFITKKSGQSDDLAHAVNFACLAFWHSQNRFPKFTSTLPYLTTDIEEELLGHSQSDSDVSDLNS